MRAALTKIRRVGGAGEGRSASPRRAELCDSCFCFFLWGAGADVTILLQLRAALTKIRRVGGAGGGPMTIEPHFVRKGCAGQVEIAILPQFLTIEPHFVRKGCAGQVEIAILPQFLTIEPHFVRKGCAGQVEIAILPQFLAIEPRFVRKGCVSCRLVGTALAPAFRSSEIYKKERARGQEEKM